MPPLPRVALAGCALLAVVNLLGGLGGGLQRLGSFSADSALAHQALLMHGALMMSGFFGSVIALERVAALRRGLWVPLTASMGGLLALSGAWLPAQLAWLASAAGLCGLYLWAGHTRAWSLPLAVEASGALALLGAALALRFGALDAARWGWSLFLVLTIAGERRELMRFIALPAWAGRAFLLGWAFFAALPLLLWLAPHVAPLLGWALLGLLGLWLLRYDMARLQWRATGWAGHTAVCLLVGYGWLLAAAMSGLVGQSIAWHLLWLGFVFAMVFGHAPLMLPPLAGLRPRHSRWALMPLGLMGLSLALRVLASLRGWPEGLALAGAGHALALLIFGLTMARLCRRQPTAQSRR
ncbi:MAG: hypothetical protein C0423_16365 [Methylibium sp.]|nr:hypothetical protein [Methylibium sp.]